MPEKAATLEVTGLNKRLLSTRRWMLIIVFPVRFVWAAGFVKFAPQKAGFYYGSGDWPTESMSRRPLGLQETILQQFLLVCPLFALLS